jgi:nitroreductase
MLAKVSRESREFLRTTRPVIASLRYQELLSNPDFDIYYGAPVLILICATAQGPWIVEDCSLAAENMMLAARGAGLGTCWIGFAQGWLGTPEGKAALGLAPECIPVAPIIVGHPESWPPLVPRKQPEIRWVGS